MSDIEFVADLRDFFFDRAEVRRRVDRTKFRALFQIGRFTRQNARQDKLRRRKRTSQPGRPPSVHSRDRFATLRNIQYAVSRDYNSVIIGPRKINSQGPRTRFTIPRTQERGGPITVMLKRRKGGDRWRLMTAGEKKRPGYEYKKRTVRIAKRPFMVPAMEDEAPKFPQLFKVGA